MITWLNEPKSLTEYCFVIVLWPIKSYNWKQKTALHTNATRGFSSDLNLHLKKSMLCVSHLCESVGLLLLRRGCLLLNSELLISWMDGVHCGLLNLIGHRGGLLDCGHLRELHIHGSTLLLQQHLYGQNSTCQTTCASSRYFLTIVWSFYICPSQENKTNKGAQTSTDPDSQKREMSLRVCD